MRTSGVQAVVRVCVYVRKLGPVDQLLTFRVLADLQIHLALIFVFVIAGNVATFKVAMLVKNQLKNSGKTTTHMNTW